MNPGRFFMPRTGFGMTPIMSASFIPSKGSIGLFGRLTSSLRVFNWSGLLNGANKTLNVVNQTIPLVRQAGPMFSNMKSMLKLAKVFGNETNNGSFNNKNNHVNINSSNFLNNNNNYIDVKENTLTQKKEVSDTNYPNFFV